MTESTLTLRDMTQDEYEHYTAEFDAGHGDAGARGGGPETTVELAPEGSTPLLPEGLATEGHRILVAENPSGEAVGYAWVGFADPSTGSTATAWLYYIRVFEDRRRSGHGRAILAAVEDLARQAGADRLGLNVFGHNRAAVTLYETAGYQVTSQRMAKELR